MSEWTADRVKEQLRRRYPATQRMGARTIPGPWVCIEEWAKIDLIAFGVHASKERIGHEVKVSRADYRSELVRPDKRAYGVESCHRFYFVVPTGLLRNDEISDEAPPELGEPSLYVPEDVGLIVVDGRGSRIAKCAPFNRAPQPIFGGLRGDGMSNDLHALLRWVSARPDPRHEGVVEKSREVVRDLRAREKAGWPADWESAA